MDQSDKHHVAERQSLAKRLKQLPWVTIFVLGILIASIGLYWVRTRLPRSVTIAGGPENGRYMQLAQGIAEELEHRFGIDVTVLQTKGSLQNLNLLETHQADFALYQPGTRLVLEGADEADSATEPAKFVSNLYPEFLVPVAPATTPNPHFGDISERIWCCNDRLSGDYAVTRLLLEHINLQESDIEVMSVGYSDVARQLVDGRINIAVICCGLHAPLLRDVLQPDHGQLVSVPAIDALAKKHASLSKETIPAGYFQTNPPIPADDFKTVALRAQLLTDSDAPVSLVEEVTRIVSDARFQRRHGLTELFAGGTSYAVERPEYEMHTGAASIHSPGLKPLLNPDFVEGTEGLRSFVVSLVAALWLLQRWWTRREIRSQEHRLDRYIRELLELERAQMDVDGDGGKQDVGALQEMLDRVTVLRQEALSEFTAHELNEDRAVDCFVEMCHALSDKINAKLTRATIAMALGQ